MKLRIGLSRASNALACPSSIWNRWTEFSSKRLDDCSPTSKSLLSPEVRICNYFSFSGYPIFFWLTGSCIFLSMYLSTELADFLTLFTPHSIQLCRDSANRSKLLDLLSFVSFTPIVFFTSLNLKEEGPGLLESVKLFYSYCSWNLP